MTALVEGAKKLVGRSRDIVDRIDGLDEAARAARGRLPDALVGEAAAVVGRAGGRLRLSGDHTVGALAGATGAGKATTFNALPDLDLGAAGVGGPAACWGVAWAGGEEGGGGARGWLG